MFSKKKKKGEKNGMNVVLSVFAFVMKVDSIFSFFKAILHRVNTE